MHWVDSAGRLMDERDRLVHALWVYASWDDDLAPVASASYPRRPELFREDPAAFTDLADRLMKHVHGARFVERNPKTAVERAPG